VPETQKQEKYLSSNQDIDNTKPIIFIYMTFEFEKDSVEITWSDSVTPISSNTNATNYQCPFTFAVYFRLHSKNLSLAQQ
jgi:hypothetical protein